MRGEETENSYRISAAGAGHNSRRSPDEDAECATSLTPPKRLNVESNNTKAKKENKFVSSRRYHTDNNKRQSDAGLPSLVNTYTKERGLDNKTLSVLTSPHGDINDAKGKHTQQQGRRQEQQRQQQTRYFSHCDQPFVNKEEIGHDDKILANPEVNTTNTVVARRNISEYDAVLDQDSSTSDRNEYFCIKSEKKQCEDHRATTIGEESTSTTVYFDTPTEPQPTSHPSMWSISYWQLMELHRAAATSFGANYSRKTMRDIVKEIIEPICKENETSYSHFLNPEGLMIDAFISHSWDEPFAAFVESVSNAFKTTAKKPNLWICAFALIQGNKEMMKEQVGLKDVPLTESPFLKALRYAKLFVVVRNCTTDIYNRIWCVCELIYANKLGLVPNRTHVTGSDNFSLLYTSCLDAQSTDPDDKEKILRVLLNEHDYKEIDDIIHKFRTQNTKLAITMDDVPLEVKPDYTYGKRRYLCCLLCIVIIVAAVVAGVIATTG